MPRPSARRSWTYARSGVDRTPIAKGLGALVAELRFRPSASRGRKLEGIGHYAGIVRVGGTTFALTTDTVGTKSLLAEAAGRWEEVGEDVVHVNVNDLAAVGARPIALVDCLSLPRADPAILAALGRGLDRGLRRANCHLLGGETAIVPDLVRGPDLGGTALGVFPGRRRPILGGAIRPGDRILGLASSGLHANGLTLVRKLLEARGWPLTRPRPGARVPLGEELLRATRCYVPAVEAIADLPGVTGLAHISGGGVRNLVRLHGARRFVLDGWPDPPALFSFLAREGPIAAEEMYQTFNMGVGFVIVVRPGAVEAVRRKLGRVRAGPVLDLGKVASGTGVSLPHRGLDYTGYA